MIHRTKISVLALALTLGWLAQIARADHKDNEKEKQCAIKVLGAAKISATKAVEAAQKQVPSGTAIEAKPVSDGDQSFFEVHLLDNQQVKSVRVDAVSGTATEAKAESEEEDREHSDVKTELGKVKISLTKAFEIASRKLPDGKPFGGDLEKEEGKLHYDIYALVGDQFREVTIDAVNGDVLKVSDRQAKHDELQGSGANEPKSAPEPKKEKK